MTNTCQRSRSLAVLFTAVMALAGVACERAPTAPTDAAMSSFAPVTSLQVVPDVRSVRLGETTTFSVAVEVGEGVPPSGPAPTWSSTNAAVITVDASGRATALALGEAAVEVAAHGRRAARHLRVLPR